MYFLNSIKLFKNALVEILEPKDYDEVADIMMDSSREGKKVRVAGLNSNTLPGEAEVVMRLHKLTGVLEFSEEDNYVRVKAGTPFQELQEFLKSRGYMVPHSYWGSVGGLFSLNLPSVYSFWFGFPKDILLGATISTGNGEIIRSGGLTTKFSSGYKIWKVLAGAMGRLGVFLELTIKVIRIPEEIRCVEVRPEEAYHFMMSTKRPLSVLCDNLRGEVRCNAVFAGFKGAVRELSAGYEDTSLPEFRTPFTQSTRLGEEMSLLEREKGVAFLGTGAVMTASSPKLPITKSFILIKQALDPKSVLV